MRGSRVEKTRDACVSDLGSLPLCTSLGKPTEICVCAVSRVLVVLLAAQNSVLLAVKATPDLAGAVQCSCDSAERCRALSPWSFSWDSQLNLGALEASNNCGADLAYCDCELLAVGSKLRGKAHGEKPAAARWRRLQPLFDVPAC